MVGWLVESTVVSIANINTSLECVTERHQWFPRRSWRRRWWEDNKESHHQQAAAVAMGSHHTTPSWVNKFINSSFVRWQSLSVGKSTEWQILMYVNSPILIRKQFAHYPLLDCLWVAYEINLADKGSRLFAWIMGLNRSRAEITAAGPDPSPI